MRKNDHIPRRVWPLENHKINSLLEEVIFILHDFCAENSFIVSHKTVKKSEEEVQKKIKNKNDGPTADIWASNVAISLMTNLVFLSFSSAKTKKRNFNAVKSLLIQQMPSHYSSTN